MNSTARPRSAEAFADGLAASSLAATPWLLYGSVTVLWWTLDDLFHVHFLRTHSTVDILFSPPAWQAFPSRMFTPLQLLSYRLDLSLFGVRPAAFYAHQLLSLTTAGLVSYATLRRWLPVPFAWLATLLFLLGIPTGSWALVLMSRHYIEGLIWAALCVWFFVEAVRRKLWVATALSSLFYLLAMLEKEVYVPLLALLPLLPEGTWRSRGWALRPHAVVLLFYLFARRAMLGTLLGGYGWDLGLRELPLVIAHLPARMAHLVFAHAGLSALLLLLGLSAGIIGLAWREPQARTLLGVSVLLLLAPMVPVAKSPSERLAGLPWLFAAIVFAFGCRQLTRGSGLGRIAAVTLIGLCLAAALVSNRRDWEYRRAEAERMSEEGRFFLTMSPGDLLRHPLTPAAAMAETRWLKEEYLGLPGGASWFADDIYLCRAGTTRHRIWEYDPSARLVRDVTDKTLSAAARYCSALRAGVPLWARFEFLDGTLSWTLGPYETGNYSLIRGGGLQSVSVARKDGYRLKPGVFSVMVRYESPAGWVTYSPELSMDLRAATRLRWERREAKPEERAPASSWN